MATSDPLTGATIYQQTDVATTGTHLGDVVTDLAPYTVPRFASAAARDTAYASWVTAGGTMANGMLSVTTDSAGGLWVRKSGAWKLELSDGGWLNITPNSPWTVGGNGAVYRVKNSVCWISAHFTRTTAWTGAISLFTLPVGARPTRPMYLHSLRQVAAGGALVGNTTVNTAGLAQYSFDGAANDELFITGSFPID